MYNMNKSMKNNSWNDNTFLNNVAKDILQRFGNDMSMVTVVFPNKRARLFMNEELLSLIEEPIWAPEYSTIAELFESIVGDTVSDTIPVNCRLYQIYKSILGDKAESLDQFWGWGEIILSDFDDIDKHLVDADSLFLNAKQLEEMESLDFLTDNQREALEHFFGSFTPDNKTCLQERFIELWAIMPQLYHRLKESMPEGIQPYQGALERAAVEDKSKLQELNAKRTYCFVGFNMLSETEKKLMAYLDRREKALFYWDYDVIYKVNPDFEAGDFIRENIKLFPNALSHQNIYNNLAHKAEITFISTTTDSIASRYIPEWLGTNLTQIEKETALVLCDEQQLQPVLHAIPDIDSKECTPKDINVTMGYALMCTPVYSFVSALIALQTEGWDESRNRFRLPFLKTIIYHPYSHYVDRSQWERYISPDDIPLLVNYLDEIIMTLAEKVYDEENFDDVLMLESIYLTHKALNQFHDMSTDEEYPLQLQSTTLRRLLRRILGTQSIPFHGEPAQGLQLMGVLETRCLDFRNILMLNVGEGFLPKNSMDNSMIPYTLRVGFGLTTPRHRIAVFAYYFYRLIQRAEHVTFMFNENSTGNVRHEMSRFLRQLQAETDIPIKTIRLEAEQDIIQTCLEDIVKTDDIMDSLNQKYNLKINPNARPFSPSSINNYLDCPMKFYLSNICGIRVEPDAEEGVDARMMGNIFHNAAERIYKEILSHTKDKTIIRSHISAYTKDKGKLLQPIIDQEFYKETGIKDFRGENILIRGVIERYLMNLLKWDEKHTPFTMVSMEVNVDMPLDININGNEIYLKTGGRVDRVDIMVEESGKKYLRIVDYKTGSHEDQVSTIKNIFSRKYSHAGYYLQTFLYAIAALRSGYTDLPIRPVLFYAARANKDDYTPTLCIGTENSRTDKENNIPVGPVNDISLYQEAYISNLKEVIAEIFNPDIPFCKTSEDDACKYCDFKQLCNRNKSYN